MQRKLQPTVLNPVSLLGAIIAIFALVIILVLLALGASGTLANPYTGILTFLLGPAALALGLILIPVGAIQRRRQLAKMGVVTKAFPVLDVNDPGQRRGIAVFAAVTACILSLMAITTWGAAEFMEGQEFCGAVCHRVMDPEGTAYAASPHARVTCVSCHIGPGAPWLVKSKISGIRQVFNYTFDRYSRPLEAPIKDLRPSRDTCEECHWPERFYGDQLRTFTHYAQDQQNTSTTQPLVFRVGGSAQGTGIHWHTTAKIWYLPLNDDRSEIGWVRVEKPGGSVDEYTLPAMKDEITPERIQSEERFMDCIDCHNRAAHNFSPIEDSVDNAMAEGSISPIIPYIKQQVMQAVGDANAKTSQDQYDETLQRIGAIEDYYKTQQPAAYSTLGPLIKAAVAKTRDIYTRSVFPDMQVGPGTYPDWVAHDGCMRCHGKLVGTKGEAVGKTIAANCLNCHYPAATAPTPPASASFGVGSSDMPVSPTLPPAVPHTTVGREACSTCHQVGATGIGGPGGVGLPADHRGREDPTCIGCHYVAPANSATASPTEAQPAANSAQPAAAAPAAEPVPISAPAPATATAPAAPPPPPAAPAGPPAVPHTTQGRESCTTCHTPGGPGVGAPGGTGLPADHQGRTDATCIACHKAS